MKVDNGTEGDRIQARKMLAHWRDDPDLAALRDSNVVDKLPRPNGRNVRCYGAKFAALNRPAEMTR